MPGWPCTLSLSIGDITQTCIVVRYQLTTPIPDIRVVRPTLSAAFVSALLLRATNIFLSVETNGVSADNLGADGGCLSGNRLLFRMMGNSQYLKADPSGSPSGTGGGIYAV